MLLLLLSILAVYRLAQLISLDDGPFDVFKRLRLLCGQIAYKYKNLKTLADLVNCPYCLGVWFALFVVIALRPSPWWLHWLAIAGGQAFLQSMGGNNATE